MTPSEESGNAASSSIPTQSESMEDTSSSSFDPQILEDWLEEENTSSEKTTGRTETEENSIPSTAPSKEETISPTTEVTIDVSSETEGNTVGSETPSESSQAEETTTKTENDATDETQESSEDHGIVLPDDEL